MSWDIQKEAHRALYLFTRHVHFEFAVTEDHIVTFEEMGEWRNLFIIRAETDTPDEAKRKARDFALRFNADLFRGWGVAYEEGVTPGAAVQGLAEALTSNTYLKEIGDVVDGAFLFPSERELL
tara:strand:+ start:215 stop:583 length:369 start_codon:yes stop_codon:yes gene_type:complete